MIVKQQLSLIMRWATSGIGALLISSAAWAEQDYAKIVAELRHEGQLQQAETYVAEQWRRDDLTDRARADLAIQLALVHTEQALAAPPELREGLWQKAEDACAALIDGWPENSRRVLVEVQRALVSLARGQQARDLGEVSQALEHLRAATRELQAAADHIGRRLIELRLRGAAAGAPDELRVAELESLEAYLAFYLAQSQRQLGLCYPPGSSDRDDALLQAERRLAPLAQRTPADDLAWKARVELLVCHLDLGRAETAKRLREVWLEEKPPANVAARLVAAESYSASAMTPSASVQERSATPSSGGGDFDAELQKAAVERSDGRWAAAAERLRRVALRQPDHPRSAGAHRLAVLSAADAVRNSAPDDRAAAAEAYEQLLREHLVQWPTSDSADEVRLWLGQLLIARRDWTAAIDELRLVSSASPPFAESVRLLAHCYDQRLQQLSDEGNTPQRAAAVLSEATHRLQPIITGPDNRWPESWSQMQCHTATAIARLHLRFSPQPSEYAERLLSAVLAGAPTAPESAERREWEGTARALLVTALLRNAKSGEASQLVDQLATAPSEALFDILTDIDRLLTSPNSATDRQRESGELALEILSLVDSRRGELEGSEVVRYDSVRATALAATGNRAAALTLCAALASNSPEDGDVQERYATLLAASESPSELRQALAHWQVVETRSRRGSPRWRRARQARLELLSRLGETAEAEKLRRLTRLLYPDWDGGAEPGNGN